MKKFVIDRLLYKFFDKYGRTVCLVFILFVSVLIRVKLSPITITSDYDRHLLGWISEYQKYSFWEGMSRSIGNYYVPYNILINIISRLPGEPWLWISLTSCAAEYVTVLFVYLILKEVLKDKYSKFRYIMFSAALLFIPVAVFNSSLWKQCDSIYVCFAVLSLYYLLKDKCNTAFIIYSVGFVFKQHIVFLLPLYIILYFSKRKYSILYFFWIPVMYFLTGLPAIIAGRGIRDTYMVYLGQVSQYPAMTMNSLSVWQLGLDNYSYWGKIAVLLTMSIFAVALIYVTEHRDRLDASNIVGLAAWVALTSYVFLPSMHERYDYLGIILISIYALALNSKSRVYALVLNLCSMFNYIGYIFGVEVYRPLLSLVYLCMYIGFTCVLKKRLCGV